MHHMWITDFLFHLTNFCLQIHEEIEEVVTTYSDSDDGNTSPPFDQKHKICLNISSSDTAEFPELGMELRGAGRGRGEEGGLVLSPPDTSWHQNWLFRRQLSSAARPRVCPPVSMLVPNPLQVSWDWRRAGHVTAVLTLIGAGGPPVQLLGAVRGPAGEADPPPTHRAA